MNCGLTFIRVAYLDFKSDTIVIKLRKRAHIERAIAGLHIKSKVVWAKVVCPHCEENCAVTKSAIGARAFNVVHISVAVSEEGKLTKFTTAYDVLNRRFYRCPKCKNNVQSYVISEGCADTIIVNLIKSRNNPQRFQENVTKFRSANKEDIIILESKLNHLSQPAYEAWSKQEKLTILQTPIEIPSTINGVGRVGQPSGSNLRGPSNTDGPIGQPRKPDSN